MITESFFRQIMDLITAHDSEQRVDGALAMGNIATALDLVQADAFAEALARQAVVEPDPDVQQRLFNGLLDLISAHDIDPATLQPVLDIPRDQLAEDNADYLDDFIEYRDLPR